ncbi:hypothetical protein M8J75_013428 [Diaphorina citri]|nr:hypothetical protein M8J75_013428 [Diaphorina citri]
MDEQNVDLKSKPPKNNLPKHNQNSKPNQAFLQSIGKKFKKIKDHTKCIKEIFGENRNLVMREMTHCPKHTTQTADIEHAKNNADPSDLHHSKHAVHPSHELQQNKYEYNADVNKIQYESKYNPGPSGNGMNLQDVKNAFQNKEKTVARTIEYENIAYQLGPKYSYVATLIKSDKNDPSKKPKVLGDVGNKPASEKDKLNAKYNGNNMQFFGKPGGNNDQMLRNYNIENPYHPLSHKIVPGNLPFFVENDANNMQTDQEKKVRMFNCQKCTKSFRHKSSLKQHCISIHEQSKYKCLICLKEFNRISSLNTHKSIHDVEKKFKCGHCGKAFHQKGNLKHHIFTHVSIRPYECKRCHKSFHQPSNLRTHLCIYEVMDPLPLTVILHEGEGLVDVNLQLDLNFPERPFNYLSNWPGPAYEGNVTSNVPANKTASTGITSFPPTAPVEYDAISYCFNCNLGFTHKLDASHLEYDRKGQCPMCGQTLHRRVIPKFDGVSFPVRTFLDEKYPKLHTFGNFCKENGH